MPRKRRYPFSTTHRAVAVRRFRESRRLVKQPHEIRTDRCYWCGKFGCWC